MQISRRILLAGVTAAMFLPMFTFAADSDAQIRARKALEEKMKELDAREATPTPPAQPVQPKAAPAPAPQRPVAAPPQPAQPRTAAPAVRPAPPQPTRMRQTAPDPFVVAPAPAPADPEAVERARAAMRQQVIRAETPVVQVENPAMRPPSTSSQTIVVDRPVSARAAQAPAAKRAPAPARNAVILPPLTGPPTGLSPAKEQRLQELLVEYQADRITPDQYQAERVKILRGP